LRIDVPAAAGRHVLAPALAEFAALHPEISVEMGSSDRPVDLIAEGVDCVIRGGLVHDELLVARALGEFEIITCAAPAYLRKHGTPRTPEELLSKGHCAVNFFSSKTGRLFPFEFTQNGNTVEILLPHQASANDADTQLALCLQGLGLMQYPRTEVLQQHLAQGRLKRVLPKCSAGGLKLYVLYPRNRHLSLRVRVFVDWVVALYAEKFAALDTEKS
jgi:LysR family transcriptional regulator, regulator for bpeEF and oprC